jgi:hypothetical protein
MKIVDFEGTLIVLSDGDAQAPKRVEDAHQMYVYVCNSYCAFSWY